VHTQVKNRDYRADIDGLRAIAILSVFLYHLDSSLLPGGYTGVDIFFVISGFLITSHILYEINYKKDFSFKRFYLRRIKRILPALLFMTLMVIAAGYFILTSFYFQSLGEQAFSTTLSYSNIYFYLTAGYFDLDASLKPLLHTWSLGVEEQFYLVWPAIIVSISFFIKKTRNVLAAFLLILALSFLLNYFFRDDLSAIFYLMPFRIFEFSVGAIIAVLLLKNPSRNIDNSNIFINLISLFALLLIVSPMFYLNDRSVFPYYNALPTVIGSSILIYYRNSIISHSLSFRPLVFIGLISYSLYLYHWPVIVLTKFQYSELSNIYYYIIVISASFIISALSYHLIEKPFRYSINIYISLSFALLFVGTLIVSFAVKEKMILSFFQDMELVEKSIKEVAIERHAELSQGGCNLQSAKDDKHCNWGAENQILFFGNSHNIDGYNIFDSFIGNNYRYNLIYAPDTYDCEYKHNPDGSVNTKIRECTYAASKLSSERFISNIDVLVVSFFEVKTRGSSYMPIIQEMRRKNPDINIIVMGGFIGLRPNNCSELINKYGDYDACNSEKYVTYWGGDEEKWLLRKDFSKHNYLYIDRISLLCGENKELKDCKTRSEDELFFYDGDHFSLRGSHYIGKLIADRYKEQLNNMGIHH